MPLPRRRQPGPPCTACLVPGICWQPVIINIITRFVRPSSGRQHALTQHPNIRSPKHLLTVTELATAVIVVTELDMMTALLLVTEFAALGQHSHVSCRTDRGYFCNTFFNQTVDVIDQPRWIDTQLLFLGLIGCGVLGVIGEFLLIYSLPWL